MNTLVFPISNDMASKRRGDPPLPLVKQKSVIEAPANQATLTQRYTREAVNFIERNRKRPFLLYLPHTFPHLPLFASKDFHGKSANGRYGDSVEEIDWSTGQILNALKKHGLEKNTLVIFTSDNGSNGRNGGSNAPLSGSKGSTMEGGMRVPMIARWPGRIPADSTCSALASTMDFLPTFCALSEAKLSKNKNRWAQHRAVVIQRRGIIPIRGVFLLSSPPASGHPLGRLEMASPFEEHISSVDHTKQQGPWTTW